ncbi:LysR substrate-binding domain-containing protein [Pseudomonas sp. WJP1]|uniref:LysR substrate-binding domain-containing protein n=1 Tax=Pseudomonas sp. WJP1 TaxID=2986947 RepID=UPI00234AC94D|nr:LysR substrate-binding domain-containing protein [Pseudomonas sp. WJP1]WCM52726.1 LysR substrate-binding domain-containing protein [Pseudomonas sp. WJP1]
MALLEEENFDPRTVNRTMRFAIADDLEVALLPRLLRALQEKAPGVRLVMRDADYHAIDRILQLGDAEVVLAALMPELQLREPSHILYEESFVALFDRKQIAPSAPMRLDEYLATPQLLISPRGEITGMLEPQLQELGRTRNVIATLARFSTLPLVLKETPILCNVPSTTAHFLANHFDLAISALPFDSPRFNIGIAWQHVLNQDPFTRWFTSLVSELMMLLRHESQGRKASAQAR